ncbi:hypothetical protein C2E21_3586 [Chlorella sorokiniana]|uniref:Ion channel n=1 Tax=Chlorella sorokiniana TaxID=3076 RepID=A0A2P6TVC2_CHLSO|nr:hypothetical protein C2E21_3586 [Chlorella sorokiniana]|eukprot:PRW58011.1 hypothetical protein C2E21_3586 [Chlorella sorokiniana]
MLGAAVDPFAARERAWRATPGLSRSRQLDSGLQLPPRLPGTAVRGGRAAATCLPIVAAFRSRRIGASGQSQDGPGPGSNGAGPVKWVVERGPNTLHSVDSVDAREASKPPPAWQQALGQLMERLKYKYFNWRQDTWSDLQLFLGFNLVVFLAGALFEGAVIRAVDDSLPPPPAGAGPLHTLWHNLYTVLAVVLGQDLPPAESAGWPSQFFAIVVAVFGLASFALVLALIEQVVLEVLDNNVKRGCAVFETGHTVILAWCESSRGIAQLTRILTQLCAANRGDGGGVVVVLTQHRGKLEMEELFREVVPLQQRFGTKFVFRQGSPLDPVALRNVAAADARRIIVCSDHSKQGKDADAQVLRTCVLLDELIIKEQGEGGGGPVVVVQIKTEDAMPLVRYACSPRVIPVPTNKVNARRYVRLLHNPIATVFSRNLMDFYSPAHAFIDAVPEVEGLTFRDLHFRFVDALVVGLHNSLTGHTQLNPPPDRVVRPGDSLITLRPGRMGLAPHRALPEAVHVELGNWTPMQYTLQSHDDQPLGVDTSYGHDSGLAISARAHGAALSPKKSSGSSSGGSGTRALSSLDKGSAQGLFVLPLQYSNTLLEAKELLIAGWGTPAFMWELLAELDHSDQGLPKGSKVTLFNEHDWSQQEMEDRLLQYHIKNLEIVHVKGDPRSMHDMRRLVKVSKFKAAVVVSDSLWCDVVAGGSEADPSVRIVNQAEMLALDSACLMVQLNIRLLLEEGFHPSISIICEKLTYVGVTRFEDDTRLPLGIAINSSSYAAKALTQVAVDPRFLKAYLQLGVESDMLVQDASAFASEGEELSFLQLQARAASVRQVLLGYYRVPQSAAEPLELVVNPQGLEERSRLKVWHRGDSRCKLVTLCLTKRAAEAESSRSEASSSTSSGGGTASFVSVAASSEEEEEEVG